MASRHSRHLQTGRAQLMVDVTTLEKSGEGSVELTGGGSGSVDTLTVDSVAVISGAVNFNTSLAQTALDLADNINNHISAPNYHARAVGVKVYIWQAVIVAGTLTITSGATTITTTDDNLSGGAIGDGTSLGYTDEGFDLIANTEWLKETVEESGVTVIKKFYIGENIQINTVLKQFDVNALALKFGGQVVTTGDVARLEFPSTLAAGDDTSAQDKVMVLVPDNKAYPTLLIRRGSNGGESETPIRFRTQEVKKIALLIDCMPDESHSATNYKTAGLDLAQNLTL